MTLLKFLLVCSAVLIRNFLHQQCKMLFQMTYKKYYTELGEEERIGEEIEEERKREREGRRRGEKERGRGEERERKGGEESGKGRKGEEYRRGIEKVRRER